MPREHRNTLIDAVFESQVIHRQKFHLAFVSWMASSESAAKLQNKTRNNRATPMNNNNQQFDVARTPRPVRSEWERAIASLRPWLSAEKFAETEKVHWRMFDRANSWFELGGLTTRRDNKR